MIVTRDVQRNNASEPINKSQFPGMASLPLTMTYFTHFLSTASPLGVGHTPWTMNDLTLWKPNDYKKTNFEKKNI